MARKPHLVVMSDDQLYEYKQRLLQEHASVITEQTLRRHATEDEVRTGRALYSQLMLEESPKE